MKAFQGQGGNGAVYRAERAGWRRSEPGALKVSLRAMNGRMAREVELLSRLSHPSIPRLLDRGGWQSPSKGDYPFFVMEWVQGTPLYAWAEQSAPSSRQVCRVLAHLARALEAVHAAGAVHRDFKGDNVLVRLLDRLPVLIDFGSCHFAGAQRITWHSLPPMTLEYLSPQAKLFYLHSLRHPEGYYPPSPADDLYALGVTAYRLVMGQYPPPIDARQDEQGLWQVTSPDLRPLLESNPRVEPELREVLVRLLSVAPEQRGTAAQVAEELEAAASEEERSKPSKPPVRHRAWKPWLTLAAAACAVWLWNSKWVPRAFNAQAPDVGTVAVGDTSCTGPQATTAPSKKNKPISQEPPPPPRPEQARPDERGRCPGNKQVLINGGCWIDVSSAMSAGECVGNAGLLFKGKCYVPAPAPPRKPVPTSDPGEAR